MRFLKLTLILRDEAWRVRRGMHTGCWDQGSNCPFCGLVFHLGCATRCGQHLRAHIFLFTLLWSCLLSGPRARHFTAVCSWLTWPRQLQVQEHTQTIWVSFSFYGFFLAYIFVSFLPFFPRAVLLFAPFKSGRKLN